MAKRPLTVKSVCDYLDKLDYGTYTINDFVAKKNQEAWKKIVIDYCQTHAELSFNTEMTKIKKIDISYMYGKQLEIEE